CSLLYCSTPHLDLHSFPTRRSSDLELYQKLPNLYNSYKICAACCVEIFSILFIRDFMMKKTIAFSGLAISALLLTACASNPTALDRKSTRLNSSHVKISYAVFCLKK